MSKFVKGDSVLLSIEGLRDSAITNLGASKLAPRFIGPFKVFKLISDAYTLDIPTSLRLHPTFYVRRLKQYRPATLHGLALMTELGARMSTSPPVLLDTPVHRECMRSRLCIPMNVAFQVPHPFKQLAVRRQDLTRSPLHLCITLDCSFQSSVISLVHRLVSIVLGNQDASVTFARSHHRLWMRKAACAGLWIISLITKTVPVLQHHRLMRRARF